MCEWVVDIHVEVVAKPKAEAVCEDGVTAPSSTDRPSWLPVCVEPAQEVVLGCSSVLNYYREF